VDEFLETEKLHEIVDSRETFSHISPKVHPSLAFVLASAIDMKKRVEVMYKLRKALSGLLYADI